MRVIAERPPLPLERPLLDALDCCWLALEDPLLAWLRAFALRRFDALALRRFDALALRPPLLRPLLLRPLLLRPLDELARVLRLPDAFALRVLPLLRVLPPLRVLPLLRLGLLDPLAF